MFARGIAETARLIASLELRDQFSGNAARINSSLTGLERGVQRASSGMGGFSRVSAGAGAAMTNFRGRLGQVGGALGTVAGVGGIFGLTAAFGKAISSSRDFDTALRRIVGLTDVTADEIGGVREAILDLSGEVGKAPQELADGFYFLASAGLNTKEALATLTTAATASATGLGATEDVAKILGATINAYGHANITAAQAGDILAQAIKDGTAEASDFTTALQYVIPTGAAMGVTFDQLTAAIAGMTLGGTDASTAATNLNQVFTSLLKPTGSAVAALKDVGLSTKGIQRQLKEEGLLATLETLREKFGNNNQAIAAVFGNVRALRGVLGLLNLDADQLHKVFGDTADATGSLKTAFDETEGPGRKMDRAFASIQATLITLGDTWLPAFAEALSDLGQWLTTHRQDVTNFGKGALDLVKTLGSIIGGIASGIARVWDAIPDPFKDLLIKGLVADRTIKFLFGFSPIKLGADIVGGLVAKLAGSLAANKLVPQNIVATQPIPVFVTNPGFGGPGGGTPVAGAPPAGGGGWSSWVRNIARIAIPILVADAILQTGTYLAGINDERHRNTVDPTRGMRGTNVPSERLQQLLSVNAILRERLEASPNDQNLIRQLEANRAALAALRGEIIEGRKGPAATPLGQFDPRNAGGVPVRVTNPDDVGKAGLKTLEDRLIRDRNFKPEVTSPEQFLRILRRTSEFGEKGTGTTIEHGPTTGRDPTGQAFVGLVKRLDDKTLRSVAVQGEIRRHIQAAREVLAAAKRDGDEKAQRLLRGTIRTLDRILTGTNRQNKNQERTRDAVQASGSKTAQVLRGIEGDTNATSRNTLVTSQKDFSPSVNVTVPVTTTVAVNDIIRQQTIARYAANVATGFTPDGP